jgi:hypothetical protein
VPSYRFPPRRARLAVHPLEGRVVPASIAATFTPTTGLLTLTGTDDAEDVTIHLTGAGATFTSNNGTTLAAPVVGQVKSIKADFKGGNDTVAVDNVLAFNVTGPVAIKLGDGNNVLDLVTSGAITLGGLTVTGGDGTDTVNVSGGAGSKIGGTATFTYANGGSETNLTGVSYTAVTVTATEGTGIPNNVTANGISVLKTLSAATGSSFPAVIDITDSTLGGLRVSGYSATTVLHQTATGTMRVNGSIALTGLASTDLQFDGQSDGLTVTGNVTLIAPSPSLEAATATKGVTINGNLTVTGTAGTTTSFQTDTLSEVKGSITVVGGWFTDLFETNTNFKADKNVSLTLGGGDNVVTLGDGNGLAMVGGKVTVRTGAGNDQVTFDQVSVFGSVSVTTLGGADTLTIDHGATFASAPLATFTADLGAGDDSILVAQTPGSANPVRFIGKATIRGGLGNDFLALGLANDVLIGGDGNTQAQFTVPTSLFDGGLGVNSLDPDGQFDPATVIVLHWA